MNLTGTYEVAAPKTRVWEALTRADSLARILPGCESLEETGDNRFAATVKVRIGPVSARFKGKVRLEDLDPCNGFRLEGSGDGGASGHAKGSAAIRLEENGAGTKITYTAETQMGGKLAALGGRLVEAVSMRNIRLMMEALEREVTGSQIPGPENLATPSTAARTLSGPVSATSVELQKTLSALLVQSRLNGVLLLLVLLTLVGIWLG